MTDREFKHRVFRIMYRMKPRVQYAYNLDGENLIMHINQHTLAQMPIKNTRANMKALNSLWESVNNFDD